MSYKGLRFKFHFARQFHFVHILLPELNLPEDVCIAVIVGLVQVLAASEDGQIHVQHAKASISSSRLLINCINIPIPFYNLVSFLIRFILLQGCFSEVDDNRMGPGSAGTDKDIARVGVVVRDADVLENARKESAIWKNEGTRPIAARNLWPFKE